MQTHEGYCLPKYVEGRNLLQGKSVLITAAAGSGIGFAAARRAAEEGCRSITLSDIHEARLAEAVGKIVETTPLERGQVYHRICNVALEGDVQSLVAYADEQMDGIDVLINNAGLGSTSYLADMTDEEWDRVLGVTLTGTMRMMRCAMKAMKKRGGGVMVNNASVLGWRAQKGQCHYAAAKAGVMALTRCAALEAAADQIRINAVAPSLALHAFLSRSAPAELLQELAAREAFGRGAEVWEVANVMMFLASDYSSYLTGEVISCSSQHA